MPSILTFHLLGGTSISEGDTPLTNFRSRTAEALFIYLACHERPLSRQILADFFWDDRSQSQATANLRSILSTLRKEVGDFLIIERQTIAFNHDQPSQLDSAVFEYQMGQLQAQLNSPRPLDEETAQALEAALSLYEGEFLSDFHLSESRGFEEWVVINRERLRRLAVIGLRRLVQYHLANGRYQAGITFVDRLIAADPYNEEAQRQRMWLLARSGSRHAALQHHQAFQSLLADDLGVEPASATTAVYERIGRLTFPPPNNLYPLPAPFIGRETEIRDLQADLLRPDSRLISIVGPGGMGKTTLATQVGQQISDFKSGQFLDGVWFVPLAPIQSAQFMVVAIAQALGLTFKGTAVPREQLLAHLKEQEMLLILDNLEQLLVEAQEALSLISNILEQAPTVKLLVTSRERLNLREEQIFDIVGLPYPEEAVSEQAVIDPESAEQYSAISLFIQRAKRLSRRFDPDQGDLKAIVRLCQLLEGMPLGLEMAAASVQEEGVGATLSQLQKSFASLETTWRNVPERHRSLWAVFDHSWRLLTAEEQRAFTRLAVFQGGFSPAAAQAIAGVARPAVYQGKSLLRQDKDGRYDFHSLIHQFTADILQQDQPGFQAVQGEHGRYYLEQLKEQEPHFTSGAVEQALDLIDTEIENIRLAWQWAVDRAEFDLLNAAYLPLYLYYETRGWFEEGNGRFHQAVTALSERVSLAGESSPEVALIIGRLQSREGWLAYRCGKLDEAKAIMEQGERVFRQLGAEEELAQAVNDLGVLARRVGEYETSVAFLTEALAIRRKINDQGGLSVVLNNLANSVRMLGDYDQAQAYLLECLGLLEDNENLILAANTYNNLGEIARATGDYEKARHYYGESLAIRQKIDNQFGVGSCLNNLGSIAHTQGDYQSARQYAQESLSIFIESGNKRAATYPLSVLGRIARDEGDFATAQASFRRALQICREIKYLPKSLDILFELATVYEAMAQPALAVRLLRLVINHPNINHETKEAAQDLRDKIAQPCAGETAEVPNQDGVEMVVLKILRSEAPFNL